MTLAPTASSPETHPLFPDESPQNAHPAPQIVVDAATLGELLADSPETKWVGDKSAPQTKVSGLAIASSQIQPGWLFVGVPGENTHGAKYSPAAKEAGAVAILTDKEGAKLAAEIGLPIAVAENPRQLAGYVAAKLYASALESLLKVGVTGTNGKTTTTYFVRAALRAKYECIGLMGTVEIDTGYRQERQLRTTAEAPVLYRNLAEMSAWGMRGAVIESSAHALSLGRVNGLCFDLSIFTNLQHDHLDYYDTMEKYFDAKAQLFAPERCRRGVVCVDDQWGLRLAEVAKVPIDTVAVLTDNCPSRDSGRGDVGGTQSHWWVSDIDTHLETGGMAFNLHSPDGQAYAAICPLPGKVNVQDAALALVAATKLGVPIEQAIEGVKHCPPIPGRATWVLGDPQRQPRCLIDYAHTPEALAALLDTLRPYVTDSGRLIAVFGTDGDRDASKREELAELAAQKADVIWITDENPRWEDPQSIRDYLLRGIAKVRPGMENVTEIKTSRRDAIRKAIHRAEPEDLIVITGKGSEPYQEIEGIFYNYDDADEVRQVLADSLKIIRPRR